MPLQDTIHKWTEGSGARLLRLVLVFFGMLGLAVWYDAASFKNFSNIEAMDAAQLARNIADGKGFTTDFIRPFSMHLLREHRGESALKAPRHPDLSNAPLYPVVLAASLKMIPARSFDLSAIKEMNVYVPDLWVAGLNQILFFVAVWLLFRLARRLFDEPVAWLSAGVFAGTEMFWRFSTSGLSTMLLTTLFIALTDALSRLEVQRREGPPRSASQLVLISGVAGLLVGLLALTRYSFGWVIIPVVLFVTASPLPRRSLMVASCVIGFVVVTAPWIARNYVVSGAPLGTTGYALLEETAVFPGFELQRTLNPNFSLMEGRFLWRKLLQALPEIVGKELPRLAGSWVTAFFLVGLLMPFRSAVLRRLRLFVIGSLALFVLIQACGRTGLTADSAEINSENLLVVFAPVAFMFGVSLFSMLVEQLGAGVQAVRQLALAIFLLAACAPLLLTLFSPVPTALVLPQYHPKRIQERSNFVGPDELIMADFPWAVAWYGHRPSVWLSLNYREETSPRFRNDFETIHQAGRPIHGLYLSHRTTRNLEPAVLSLWYRQDMTPATWERYTHDWESFLLHGVYLFKEVPTGFPLQKAPFDLVPELFLTDSERNKNRTIKAE
jgi:hypothetical protein